MKFKVMPFALTFSVICKWRDHSRVRHCPPKSFVQKRKSSFFHLSFIQVAAAVNYNHILEQISTAEVMKSVLCNGLLLQPYLWKVVKALMFISMTRGHTSDQIRFGSRLLFKSGLGFLEPCARTAEVIKGASQPFGQNSLICSMAHLSKLCFICHMNI